MKNLLFPTILLITLNLSAQQLQNHRWQNRLLIIVDKEANSTKRLAQLAILKKDMEGLAERKLLLYQFTKKGYQKGLLEEQKWLAITDDMGLLTNEKATFTLYLIGLDGGVKMEKKEVVSLKHIFALIDGMPMRRAEINRN